MDIVILIGLDTFSYVLTLLLVTLGLVIIYGMMNIINMAHGELFMIGAYTVATLLASGVPFWICIMAAPIVVGVAGILIEEVVIRHVYGRPLDTILATWGLSIALKQLIIILFGPGAVSITNPVPGSVSLMGVDYPAYRLVIMALAAALALATYLVIYRTTIGLQVRAVISNRAMAGSLGVNTRRMDRATFAVGSALAGIAGAIMSPMISVDPQMGVGFLIPAFLSVLVGGLNSLVGAVVGAGTIGGTTGILSANMEQADAQIVVFLIAILIIRFVPQGLWKGFR
ncbi:urea ABC transporter permease subunit UrtB [Roseobacter litoralis]|uniref:High-affinity branched-chain amino acid transport system permease protein n=1 Tax=Roseobacter litoralis (strain ATCC 49566 / DSM 6996 / JCM 21268 / NBRC 15278 / OCh 149) TaxID=391595 RepID=F7ZLN0_ROSLO|nr:urea ABC transporter permease subunit UrtB [Roseobacter litoralis]AEI94081.1 putative high-affinity branched-chain amino acid transport system permease protein [Roseobacter litoralis Och 149]